MASFHIFFFSFNVLKCPRSMAAMSVLPNISKPRWSFSHSRRAGPFQLYPPLRSSFPSWDLVPWAPVLSCGSSPPAARLQQPCPQKVSSLFSFPVLCPVPLRTLSAWGVFSAHQAFPPLASSLLSSRHTDPGSVPRAHPLRHEPLGPCPWLPQQGWRRRPCPRWSVSGVLFHSLPTRPGLGLGQ